MKEFYIGSFHPQESAYAHDALIKLSRHLTKSDIQKIVVTSPIHPLLHNVLDHLHAPADIYHPAPRTWIISCFEEELLLPDSPVLIIADNAAVLRLIRYIDPHAAVRMRDWELFHIICESDHIGLERLQLVPFHHTRPIAHSL